MWSIGQTHKIKFRDKPTSSYKILYQTPMTCCDFGLFRVDLGLFNFNYIYTRPGYDLDFYITRWGI